MDIKTRLLILSDTHGALPSPRNAHPECSSASENSRVRTLVGYCDPLPAADVVIHCGDLTYRSKPHEFKDTFAMLRNLRAPLKLVIAGNHDSVLDEGFPEDIGVHKTSTDLEDSEAAKKIIADAEFDNVRYLLEGSHVFELANGARLTVFASPHTPRFGWWGFQYANGHEFSIPKHVDIAMTHGPPKKILDLANIQAHMEPKDQNAGCSDLFRAVYQARPRIHCFGHIHESWGAYMARWESSADENQAPSLETCIDELSSEYIVSSHDLVYALRMNQCASVKRNGQVSHCTRDGGYFIDMTNIGKSVAGEATLFLNASIMDTKYRPTQLPFILDMLLEPWDNSS